MTHPEQHAVIVKSVGAWAQQAAAALATIEDANGGELPQHLADAKAIDSKAFGFLVEALVALESETGAKVDAELVQLAGLVPVDQAIE
jgi:hypothetical protein